MGETALDIVCYYGFNDCARLLLKNGANHNIFNANGEYAVHKYFFELFLCFIIKFKMLS